MDYNFIASPSSSPLDCVRRKEQVYELFQVRSAETLHSDCEGVH